MNSYNLSKYIYVSDSINPVKGPSKVLIYSFRSGVLVSLAEQYLQAIKCNNLSKLPIKVLSKLIKNKIIVSLSENELINVLTNEELKKLDSKEFHLKIQLDKSAHKISPKSYKVLIHKHIVGQINRYLEQHIKDHHEKLNITWDFSNVDVLKVLNLNNITCNNGKGRIEIKHSLHLYLSEIKQFHLQSFIEGVSLKELKIIVDLTEDSRFELVSGLLEYCKTLVPDSEHSEFKLKFFIQLSNLRNSEKTYDHFLKSIASKKLYSNKVQIHFFRNGNDVAGDYYPNELAELHLEWLIKCMKLGLEVEKVLPKHQVFSRLLKIEMPSQLSDSQAVSADECSISVDQLRYLALNPAIGQSYFEEELAQILPTCLDCSFFPVCGGDKEIVSRNGSVPKCPIFSYNMEDRLLIKYLSLNYDNFASML